jgi:putative transposase
MAHTYISAAIHCVFSTKQRVHGIPARVQPDLWAYLGGIARANGMKALAVGGTDNHVHALLTIPAIISIGHAVELLKSGSSKWLHDEHNLTCTWQDGYGAFTVGVSQIPPTISYITSQTEHHRKLTFEDEYVAILRKHKIEYDPKFVFG